MNIKYRIYKKSLNICFNILNGLISSFSSRCFMEIKQKANEKNKEKREHILPLSLMAVLLFTFPWKIKQKLTNWLLTLLSSDSSYVDSWYSESLSCVACSCTFFLSIALSEISVSKSPLPSLSEASFGWVLCCIWLSRLSIRHREFTFVWVNFTHWNQIDFIDCSNNVFCFNW